VASHRRTKGQAWMTVATLILVTVLDTAAVALPGVAASYGDVSVLGLALKARGVLDGYPGGDLGLERTLSRAEASKLLVEALAIGRVGTQEAGAVANRFADVSSSHWAFSYVQIAYEVGLIRGYGDGSFRPENRVTKAEFMVLISRMYKALGGRLEEDYDPAETARLGPEWALREIWPAKQLRGVFSEAGLLADTLEDPISRREAISLLYRVMKEFGLLFDLEGQMVAVYQSRDLLRMKAGSRELDVPIAASITYVVNGSIVDISKVPQGASVGVILDSQGKCVFLLSE